MPVGFVAGNLEAERRFVAGSKFLGIDSRLAHMPFDSLISVGYVRPL
jgi:hypothetical protein